MEDKQLDNNAQNKTGQHNNDNKQHKTPRETMHDIDEMTAREEEYNQFNKNTVQPQPQITPNK